MLEGGYWCVPPLPLFYRLGECVMEGLTELSKIKNIRNGEGFHAR